MADDPKFYAWVDLETTGLNIHKDFIIEFAMVVTTPDLHKVHVSEVNKVVLPDGLWLDRIKHNDFVLDMHTKNGLLQELRSGKVSTLKAVEHTALGILRSICEPKEVIIAGSGVAGFDFPFIQNDMPELAAMFNYFCFDIGPIRRMFKYTCQRPDLVAIEQDENHRAMGDCLNALEQARHYKGLFESITPPGKDEET